MVLKSYLRIRVNTNFFWGKVWEKFGFVAENMKSDTIICW